MHTLGAWPFDGSTEKSLLQELHSLHCAHPANVWIDFLVDLLALGDHVNVSNLNCRSLCRALQCILDSLLDVWSLQGPFSFAMLVHEDIEEDRPWISLLEHSCGVRLVPKAI